MKAPIDCSPLVNNYYTRWNSIAYISLEMMYTHRATIYEWLNIKYQYKTIRFVCRCIYYWIMEDRKSDSECYELITIYFDRLFAVDILFNLYLSMSRVIKPELLCCRRQLKSIINVKVVESNKMDQVENLMKLLFYAFVRCTFCLKFFSICTHTHSKLRIRIYFLDKLARHISLEFFEW